MLARVGQSHQALAVAHEQASAKLLLQLLDVLGHSWLHQVQSLSRAAHAEAGIHQGGEGPELAQFHITTRDNDKEIIISHYL